MITVLVVAPLVIAASPSVASAAPVLSALIVPNPEVGWQPASGSLIQTIENRLEKVDSNDANGASVGVAADLWDSPDHSTILAITLSQWPSNVSNLDQAMRAGFANECVAITGNDPSSTVSVAGIDGSLEANCTGNGPQLVIAAARRGDYVEMVEAIGLHGAPEVGLSQVSAIATDQYNALPASGSAFGNALRAIGSLALTVGLAVGLVRLGRGLLRRARGSRGTRVNPAISIDPGFSDWTQGSLPSPLPPPPPPCAVSERPGAPAPVAVYVPESAPGPQPGTQGGEHQPSPAARTSTDLPAFTRWLEQQSDQ